MNGIRSSSDQFLASLNLLEARQAQLQQQLTSGYRVAKPSDDPSVVADILMLNAEIGKNTQVLSNLNTVKAQADAADSALTSAGQLLQNGITLAAQGANGTTTQSQRQVLAGQVQALLEQMVSISRTTVGGQYIFSGDQVNQPPYQVNLTNPNGVDRLVQTSATGSVQDSTGVTFATGQTAQTIFDHRNADDSLAGDNVFAALNNLRLALQNNDQAGILKASDSLKSAQNWLNTQQAFYGALQNRVQTATTIATNFQVQEQATLSKLRDTDVTSAALGLTQLQTNITAAMAAQAKQPITSLFDFLK